jgi:hypothetical protein
MSASGEGPERLAEILREIIGLAKTGQTNIPDIESREVFESANVQKLNINSPELLDAQGVNGINQTCSSRGKNARKERGQSEDRRRRRE